MCRKRRNVARACLLAGLLMPLACTGSDPKPSGSPDAQPSQAADGLDAYGRQAFKGAYEKLSEMLGRKDRQDELPSFTLNPFAEDKKSNARQVRRLSQQVLEVLEVSQVTDLAGEHEQIEAKAREALDEIARHQREMVSAPQTKAWYSLETTKAQHQEAVEARRADVAGYRKRQAELVGRIEEALRASGLKVTPEQVRFFLASVSGETALTLNAAFSNVKQINLHLAELIRKTGEDAATAKKYYGLHVVLTEVLTDAHEQAASKIEAEYVPRVFELLKDNQANRQETQRLLKRAGDEKARASLEANLRAQDVTDKAGRLYMEYLDKQKARLQQVVRSLQGKYEVALNTYKTAKTASALVGLIQASDKDLAALRGMELPEMMPFENAELQQKFQEIAARLKQGA
ncbi:MAG TPA: hypothetical protein VM695_02105 [Phycisphaerae bacterium]|nr:hypothetical protein [Phycisphaerae bacterium]